ncbi:MAG: 6-carboxytetrahydropterin synthase [Actinomycetota bacterium]
MYRIAVTRRFDAAHMLKGHPGKCAQLHGHSWVVEAVIISRQTGSDGMVLDFDKAGVALSDAVASYDHVYLNEVPPFDSEPPTAENVARVVFMRLIERIERESWPVKLESVTVWESEGARASFSNE